jgi:cathepsin L
LVDEWKGNFEIGLNEFSAMTTSEYRTYLGFVPGNLEEPIPQPSSGSLEPVWDWRTKGVVNPITSQKGCGSCWAFSAAQAWEGAWAIKSPPLLKFSEANLVCCCCSGCHGGDMGQAYQYIHGKQAGKWELLKDWPYTPHTLPCTYNASLGVGLLTGYIKSIPHNETDLALKVREYGPSAVAVNAGLHTFAAYKSGIYDDKACTGARKDLDHGVGCCGWGMEGNKTYWIIRNSWNTRWGEQGYMRLLAYANNLCGVATDAAFPLAG